MNTRKRVMSAQAGKLNFEVERIATKVQPGEERAIYNFTRREIEQHDISTFLGTFGPRNEPKKLRKMQGKIIFAVDGYDDEPESLCIIPEIRAFFFQCHRWWPCWTYYADLESDSLAMIACCLMPNVSMAQCGESLHVTMQQMELISFFEDGLPSAALLHSQAEIGKHAGMKLLQAVSFYLQLPDQ